MKRLISKIMIFVLSVGCLGGGPVVEAEELCESDGEVEVAKEEKSVTDISEYGSDEIIVVYKEDKSLTSTYKLQSNEQAAERITDNTVIYKLDDKAETKEAIKELSEDEEVAYIQPNYTYHLMGNTIEDPYYSLQWGLNNDGTFRYSNRTASSLEDIDINAPEAWNLWDIKKQKQQEVIVAVVDTGIQYNHIDLIDGMWTNKGEIPNNGIDDDGNGYIDDVYGWNFYSENATIYNRNSTSEDSHGTHGAGSIIAQRNSAGIAGVASNGKVKVMSVKALGGRDGNGSTEDLVRAIEYAEKMGASICNLSLGTDEEDTLLGETIKKSKMLFIAAAGNGDSRNVGYSIDEIPMYPASYDFDNIITVANIENDGNLSSTSNYGTENVDLAAPGTYIYSTSTVRQGYEYMTGTSMATPMVSAAAAMIYSYYGNITLSQVREILLSSVKKVSNLEDKVLTGGMLDIYKSLTYYDNPISTVSPEPTENLVTNTPTPTPKIVTETPKATQTPTPTPKMVTESPKATQTPTPTPKIVTEKPKATQTPTPTPKIVTEKPKATQTPTPIPKVVTETPKIAQTPIPTQRVMTKTPKATQAPIPTKKVMSSTPKVNAPKKLKVTSLVNRKIKKAKVKLRWNKVKGANGYVIYRATTKKGKYKRIKIIKKGTIYMYVNQNLIKGKRYYYKIKAFRKGNGKTIYSRYSSIVRIKIRK